MSARSAMRAPTTAARAEARVRARTTSQSGALPTPARTARAVALVIAMTTSEVPAAYGSGQGEPQQQGRYDEEPAAHTQEAGQQARRASR